MDFEKYYDKLPGFIKYNNHILNFFLKIPKILQNNNSNVIDSHNEIINLLLTSSDIKFTGTLRNIQLLHLELLKFVDYVCKKHGIDYWLDYGTLLGAVRHKGFIPWDDDVDVSIMRNDYEKLMKILPYEINKFPELKENCGLSLIIENEKNYYEDFNDIFDIDTKGLKRIDKFNFLQFGWMKPYAKLDFFPKDYIKDGQLDNFSKNYVATKYKFNKDVAQGKVNFYEEFLKKREKIGITDEKTEFYSNSLDCVQLSPVLIYETKKTFPLKTINFEGHEFNCPNNIDEHLKIRFGKDYMNIPKIIETHDIVPFIESQFSSKEEMDEYFNKSISILKKINQEF